MIKHRSKVLASALLALSLFGCADEKAAGDKAAADVKAAASAKKDPAAGKKAAAKAKAQAKAQEEEPAPALSVPEGFRYEPQGRRDPFVNPVPKPPPAAPDVPTIRPDGLPGVLLAEAQIKGIITSKEPGMTRVIISAPGVPQRKTYTAIKGATLFDAVIKEIRTDEVVFTMISPTTKQPVNRETTVKTGNTGAGNSAGDKK